MDSTDAEPQGRAVAGRHLERIAPAVIKPREDWLQESYLVVELNEVRGEKGAALTADELLSAHGEHIAQLIRGEQTQLARMTTEHVLEGRLSYYPSDFSSNLAPFMAIIAMRKEQSNAQRECGGTKEPAEQVPYIRQRRRRSGDPRP